jgi:hypothetical protein
MSSDKQIEANRLNAQRSTGPRTPAGKGRVSLNALKHGLTGRDVVLPNENPDDFESFRADLLSSLNPQGALEGVLAEKIVAEAWRLRRVPIFEATLHRRGCKELLVKQAAESVKQCEKDFFQSLELEEMAACNSQAHQDAKQRLARAQAELDDPSFNVTRVLEMFPEPFSNLWRHESTLNRAAFRTLHEFQRLQAARAGEHVPAPAMMDMDISVSGSPPLDVEGKDETD